MNLLPFLFAQQAQGTPTSGPQSPMEAFLKSPIPMMVLMVVVFYFILIRPQQKRAKEHAELLKGVKGGDKVTTNSGIVGVVITVKEKTVTVRTADSKLEILKSSIAEITERSAEGNNAAQ